ncbi:MAG: hemolysin family protein [Pseudohongiellaceae bacterium]
MGSNLLLLLVAFLLVLLNGFFVASEFGLVKLRQTRVRAIARKYGWRGKYLIRVHEDLDAYLSACQLGITLASLGLGWIGEPAFARLLEPAFTMMGIVNQQLLHGLAFFIAFFIISYLHIVIGELVPKSMAIRASERVAIWTSAPLYGFYWLMYPAIWVLNHSANWILRKINLDIPHSHEAHYSVEELKLILRASNSDEDYTNYEWRVLAQALDFRDLEVSDLMRPFNEAITLSTTVDLQTNLNKTVEHRFSRYPYLDEEGNVTGFVHLKDVFFALQKGALPDTLEKLTRPVLTVAPSLAATELFRRFRRGAPHFAVVAYKGGPPLGFITLDNLLGALVGEIRDEFRETGNQWTELDDGSLLGKGSLPIFTLERALGVDIEETGANSVAGLILHRLGDLPREGQLIEFDDFDVVVKKMSGPRVLLLRIYPEKLAKANGESAIMDQPVKNKKE